MVGGVRSSKRTVLDRFGGLGSLSGGRNGCAKRNGLPNYSARKTVLNIFKSHVAKKKISVVRKIMFLQCFIVFKVSFIFLC
jgi:hypothetical protein